MASSCIVAPTVNVSEGTGVTQAPWNGSASFANHGHIISTVLILTSVLGVPLNGLALWVLGCKVRRRNRFAVYVLNLVSADFLFLALQAVHSACVFSSVDTSN
eukprot:g14736.t1